MIVTVAWFFYLPLTLFGVVCGFVAALQFLRGSDRWRRPLFLAQLVPWVLALGACTFAIAYRAVHRDWMHLYWSVQCPLVGLFVGSGTMLCRTWHDDAELVGGGSRRARHGAVLFLLLMLVLGLLPLLLELVYPEQTRTGRNIGAPLRRLGELAAWGFGGALPECLAPITDAEQRLGIGHLPREVTVPMGTGLIAACFAIEFCVLALAGRLLRSTRLRLAFYLTAPPVLWATLATGMASPLLGCFDPNTMDSGIWTSEPGLMRSYGPALLTAWLLASALLIATWLRAPARRSQSP